MKNFRPALLALFLVFSFLCFGLPVVFRPDDLTGNPSRFKLPEVVKIHRSTTKKNFNGPTQPEVQSFKPADANNLVDLFTGDFSYNIPLLDIGGYPVNLFYSSNLSMEEEASWVGLGWNLNPGAINRNVRGLPDDFSGEKITKTYNIKPHVVFGGSTGADVELFGVGFSASLGMKYNNYTGVGLDLGAGVSTSYSIGNALNAGVSANLGLSSDAGASISPSVNLSYSMMSEDERGKTGSTIGARAGFTWNSLEGLNNVYIAPSFTRHINTPKPFDYPTGGSTIFPLNYARNTYTPSVTMPMKNLSLSFKLKGGGEVQGVRFAGSVSAFYNSQTLSVKTKSNKAYGYLYSQDGNDDNDALQDFNRERDGAFEVKHPDLPVVNSTYDVYSVSGQGVAGSFRAFRNDIGTVSDPVVQVTSNGGGLGVDVAGGAIAKIGVDAEFSETKTYSGPWTSSSNESKSFLKFRKKSEISDIKYEPVYFKSVGEKNVLLNQSYYDFVGKREPIALQLQGVGEAKARPTAVSLSNSSTNLTTNNTVKIKREQRNTNFQYLTVDEALSMAEERLLKVYTGNTDGDTMLLERAMRNNYQIGGKQISQIIIVKDDGTRYVYGLPAYNFKKQEVSFNISNSIDRLTADSIILAQYTPGIDNSSSNSKGTNNYFSEIETPAYAYAYYLTEILSPDFVDMTGDGASSDDLGTFTKFTYYRDSLYKWRAPFQKNTAFFNAGHLYDEKDDMGSYQYGEKEIFYLRSVETRNYVATFESSARKDAHGVVDENGGIDVNSSLRKLNSISLYTKSAYLKNDRIPVKKVNFEYDYSLCKKNPSSEADSGKLTLKRVYFTYQKSTKGKNHAFVFQYKGMNPSYSVGASDRWGTYKSVKKRTATGSVISEQARSIANNEFPYTDQENRTIQADSFASAWALTDIQTPNGGNLKVSYEADDYAYVQNKKAMELLQIIGFSSTQTGQPTNNIFIGSTQNNFLHIKTSHAVTSATAPQLIQGIRDFYFTARINITGQVAGTFGAKLFEPIDGFFELVNNNVVVVDSTHIVVQVKSEGNYQPFTLAALKRVKTEYPGVAYEFPEIDDDILGDLGNAFIGLAKSAGDLLSGGLFNRLVNDGVGGEIQPGKSFVRMNAFHGFKIGGGSRVRKIELSDNWNTMTSGKDSSKTYAIEYSYTQLDENKKLISSGVASYEPVQGGNENPFVVPEYYNVSKKFSFMGIDLFEVENERKYLTGQYGESFFPGASVGYSTVTVRANPDPKITRHATGKMVYTFYTAYDFPTIFKKTGVAVSQLNQFFPIIVYISNVDKLAASQGYYFEMNDMHGKQKGVFTFSSKDSLNPISGKTTYYRTANGTLDNNAKVVDRNGRISEAEIGIETDAIADERESSTFVKTPSLEANVDIILIGIFPIPIPVPIPKYATEDILFRSSCVTKVSQRSGLIDSVVTFDGGARFVTKTLLYDAVTGSELLTSVNNEFGEKLYTLNIPAHWANEGMGPAFYNYGLEISSATMNGNSNFVVPNADSLFFVGDEIHLTAANGTSERGWVLQVKGNEVTIIDAVGSKFSTAFNNASLKVIRSGRRNMQSVNIGSILSKQNPANGNTLAIDAAHQIINSTASQFGDNWQTYAAYNIHPQRMTCSCQSKADSNTQKFASTLLSAIVGAYNQGDSIQGMIYKAGLSQPMLLKYFNLNADSVCYSLDKKKTDITVSFYDCTNQKRLCGASLHTNSLGKIVFAGGSVFVSPNTDVMPNEFCDDYGFRVPGSTGNSIKGDFECLALRSCQLKYMPVNDVQICGITGDSVVNPFRIGLLGNYRQVKSLIYLTDRTTGHVQDAGVYSNYDPYWACNAISNSQPSKWTWTEQSTKIDPYGKVVEIRDTLGRFRSDLYGFNNNLVVASARNAHYRQIAFLSFEDVDFKNTNNSTCWLPKHFAFDNNTDSLVIDSVSHTGRRSLLFRNNFDYSITKVAPAGAATPSSINSNGVYQMTSHELIGTFSPDPGEYYVDAWIRIPNDTLSSYNGLAEVEVITDLHDTVYFRPYGLIVDGWQKIGGRFNLKQGYRTVTFRFINKSIVTGFIDDIRVQPFDASMETYVYDAQNLRLMSTLDDNNFAIIYEYDEEGELTRVKKETYQGILTMSETRSGKPRN